MFEYIAQAFNMSEAALLAVVCIFFAIGILAGAIALAVVIIKSKMHVAGKVILILLIIGALVAVYYYLVPIIITFIILAKWAG